MLANAALRRIVVRSPTLSQHAARRNFSSSSSFAPPKTSKMGNAITGRVVKRPRHLSKERLARPRRVQQAAEYSFVTIVVGVGSVALVALAFNLLKSSSPTKVYNRSVDVVVAHPYIQHVLKQPLEALRYSPRSAKSTLLATASDVFSVTVSVWRECSSLCVGVCECLPSLCLSCASVWLTSATALA